MYYTTLHQVRTYLRLGDAQTQDDELIKVFALQSTRSIDRYCKRRFDVYRDTVEYDYPVPPVNRIGVFSVQHWVASMNWVAGDVMGKLALSEDLLLVITLTNGDGTTIAADDYVLEPNNLWPKNTVRLKRGSGITWQYDESGNRKQVVTLDGYFGYHTRYADLAWVNSLDTLQSGITDTDTSLSVADADGIAGDSLAVRFQVGNQIRLTHPTTSAIEFMDIIEVDTAANTLTVSRGFNGTTAVAFPSGVAIYVYRPMDDIVLACTRLVAWRYRQKDADSFNREILLGTGEMIIPTDMPADVQRLLPAPKGERLAGVSL